MSLDCIGQIEKSPHPVMCPRTQNEKDRKKERRGEIKGERKNEKRRQQVKKVRKKRKAEKCKIKVLFVLSAKFSLRTLRL